ncbi:TonB-dependent receptor [Sinomicrobium kalidii]|uniref:SusC/RagA family TonB-linked outer membrane protein n=1 Tax=Sinomicrobium kalidii TaxID=2900738 RepID=UPI001E4C63C8|nr:TonB-dependent receptor [Sinomicrobium kalidii]UGU17885.1 TonB-dependent receptor [Sinomicrobium kalidii]
MTKLKFALYLVFMFAIHLAHAQTGTITGTVSDTNGTPLPGVNVVVENTSRGVVTDFDGNYTIEDVSPEDRLVFSYIGMETRTVAVGSQTTIDMTLKDAVSNLDEVVVIAYGSSTKRDLTGAVGSVSSEDIEKFPATSVDQALQGKTAGVQITQNSGSPGSSVSVNIRGVGSFGNNQPLYVVDGFPTQDISFLNVNDIKSISVLKDASAAAIYGVRANAGVVIIETKRGEKDKVSISVDSWVGTQAKPKEIEMLDARTFAGFALQMGESQGKGILDEWRDPQNLTDVNWQDYAFRTGFRQGHNVSIRGGGEKARAALSVGMIDEKGVIISSSNKRYNVGLNADYKVSDQLSVRGDLKYAYSETFQNLSQGYYGFTKLYTNAPYLSDWTGTNVPFDGNGNYGAFTDSSLLSTSNNVLAAAKQNDNDNGLNNLMGNFAVDYSFLDGFKATGKFGFRTQNYAGWSFQPKYDRGSNDNNPTALYTIDQNTANEYIAEGLLEYKKNFNEDHHLEVLLGASTQRNKYKNVYVAARGFLNNSIRDLAAADEVTERSGTWGTSTFASTFARVNYSYKGRYSITGTVRRDGVGDKFAEDNLYGTFPSVAVGWNIDRESFMENSGFDLLKLRASWGETGNSQGISPFQYLTTYTGGSSNDDSGYIFGGGPVAGLAPETLANPNLVWESQVQTNIGLDVEFLDRRLYFTADYFDKSAKDFLLNETIPSQNGFDSRAVNAGNVVNRGLELLLGYRKSEGDFKWDVSVNFTTIQNEITALTDSQDFIRFPTNFVPDFVDNWLGFTRSYVGGNVGTFYGYRADGIFQSQEEIDALNQAAPDGVYQESTGTSPVAPGDRRFRDLNGDNQITAEDREVIGSPFPDFYGGLNFNGSYKNFELGLSFYGSYGNDILNFVRVELETAGGYGLENAYSNVSRKYYENRWTPENPSDKYARAVVEDVNKNNRVSDHFVEDGSYLRLRNIQLAYNFPMDKLDFLGLNTAKVYLSAQNLFTITGYSGLDPEIGEVADIDGNGGIQSRGVDFGAYPSARTFTVGVNLKF